MHVFQTAGVPPSIGSSIRAIIGSTRNRSAEAQEDREAEQVNQLPVGAATFVPRAESRRLSRSCTLDQSRDAFSSGDLQNWSAPSAAAAQLGRELPGLGEIPGCLLDRLLLRLLSRRAVGAGDRAPGSTFAIVQ